MRLALRPTPEVVILAALMVASVLTLVFMDSLVAEPKLLFGRSLSALEPSLFPSMVLRVMALLCALRLFLLNREEAGEDQSGLSAAEWRRGAAFFGIMILYALTMLPLGFTISTAITIMLLSRLLGSQSVVQVVLLALVAPVLLYLAATRLLAVSLPELNLIEMAVARLLAGGAG
jgi:putative tricarboxylic transport membrane protein